MCSADRPKFAPGHAPFQLRNGWPVESVTFSTRRSWCAEWVAPAYFLPILHGWLWLILWSMTVNYCAITPWNLNRVITGSRGWHLIGFCLPVAGVAAFLCCREYILRLNFTTCMSFIYDKSCVVPATGAGLLRVSYVPCSNRERDGLSRVSHLAHGEGDVLHVSPGGATNLVLP